MRSYVTLADVAKAARVSATTVSLALRRHPRIPKATQERIQETARLLGYESNALLSSLAALRHKAVGSPYTATVALISNHLTRGEWKRINFQRDYWKGAEERGKELGYKVEEFFLRERGMSHERFSKILKARNISGILFLPQPRARSHLQLRWDYFSPVAFGFSLTRPQLHVVSTYHLHSAMTAVRRLRAHGYRRIGFIGTQEVIGRGNLGLMAGFLAEQQNRPAKEQLAPLILPKAFFNQRAFGHWLMNARPDVLFLGGVKPERCMEWLSKMGLRFPDDIGLAAHSVKDGDQLAGIHENSRLIGAKAIELVKAMIDRGERGLPEVPIRILIEGKWNEGKTIRRVNR